MRPNFLFIGPDKSGSSWLFRVLGAHPDVFLSPAKDIYFFDRYFDRGQSWYFSRFDGATAEHRVIGEICHDYLYCAEAPQRIIETLGPDTKILTCLREPADRAFSDYLNRIRSGSEAAATFAETVSAHPNIVRAGRYSSWVKGYLDTFPAGNVHVAAFDDLTTDPQAFLDSITDWLGISRLSLTVEQLAPARAAAVSRAPRVTRWLRKGASTARALGLEGIVGRVKSSGSVESILYRTYDERPQPPADVVGEIQASVKDDVVQLSELTGVPFASLWGYDLER